MSLALLFHYLMLNMFRMLIHLSSGACDLFVELFRGLYCSGSMCVGVTLWFGCGGNTTHEITQQISRKLLRMDVQGGSNMTGTDVTRFTHKSVPVIFEPPCINIRNMLSIK